MITLGRVCASTFSEVWLSSLASGMSVQTSSLADGLALVRVVALLILAPHRPAGAMSSNHRSARQRSELVGDLVAASSLPGMQGTWGAQKNHSAPKRRRSL